MEPRTFKGTWEEIVRHGSELTGHRVRVTVLDEPIAPERLGETFAQLVARAEELAAGLPPLERAIPADSWSEGVDEKYRRQGFIL